MDIVPSPGLYGMPIIIALAVMLKRAGGSVTITQADIDQVGYLRVIEDSPGDGTLILTLDESRNQIPQ